MAAAESRYYIGDFLSETEWRKLNPFPKPCLRNRGEEILKINVEDVVMLGMFLGVFDNGLPFGETHGGHGRSIDGLEHNIENGKDTFQIFARRLYLTHSTAFLWNLESPETLLLYVFGSEIF